MSQIDLTDNQLKALLLLQKVKYIEWAANAWPEQDHPQWVYDALWEIDEKHPTLIHFAWLTEDVEYSWALTKEGKDYLSTPNAPT